MSTYFDKLDADNVTLTVCGGNAGPDDVHLASVIHCIDDEIVEWLKLRERRLAISHRRRRFARLAAEQLDSS
jgi:hypothetical protein